MRWNNASSLNVTWLLEGEYCAAFRPCLLWGYSDDFGEFGQKRSTPATPSQRASQDDTNHCKQLRGGTHRNPKEPSFPAHNYSYLWLSPSLLAISARIEPPSFARTATQTGHDTPLWLYIQYVSLLGGLNSSSQSVPTLISADQLRASQPRLDAHRSPAVPGSGPSSPALSGSNKAMSMGPYLVQLPPPGGAPTSPGAAGKKQSRSGRGTETSQENAHSPKPPEISGSVCVGLLGDSQLNASMFATVLQRFTQLDTWPNVDHGASRSAHGSAGHGRLCTGRQRPHLLLHAGDSIQYGGAEEWRHLAIDPVHAVQDDNVLLPMLRVLGNHDLAGSPPFTPEGQRRHAATQSRLTLHLPASLMHPTAARPQDIARFMLGDSAFTCSTAHSGALRVVTVNSLADNSACLRKALRTPLPRNVHFTLLLTHIPPVIEYWERKAWFELGEARWTDISREKYLPLAIEMGVDLFVGGHSHLYQRSHLNRTGPVLAIVGGAGGALEAPAPEGRVQHTGVYAVTALQHHGVLLEVTPAQDGRQAQLHWVAATPDGQVLDHFTLHAKGPSFAASTATAAQRLPA